jgi:hypothetical protein
MIGEQNALFGCGGVSYTVRARRSASSPANSAGSSGTPPSGRSVARWHWRSNPHIRVQQISRSFAGKRLHAVSNR